MMSDVRASSRAVACWLLPEVCVLRVPPKAVPEVHVQQLAGGKQQDVVQMTVSDTCRQQQGPWSSMES